MNEITKRPAGDVRPAVATSEDEARAEIKRFVKAPILAVPAANRLAVTQFWCEWSHLLKSDLSLCMRLRRLIGEYTLSAADLAEVFRRIDSRAETLVYVGELLASLTGTVKEVAKERNERERAARLREDAKLYKPEDLALMKEKLAAGWSAGGG